MQTIDKMIDALWYFLQDRLPPCRVCCYLQGVLTGACAAVALTALVLLWGA